LKDFYNYLWLVNEADDPHLALALGTGKGIGLIDLSDEVGPALSNRLSRVRSAARGVW
jgi:hypothetical protein